MAMNNAYLDAIATAGAAAITHVALANAGVELSGGSYSREAISWDPPSNGVITASVQPVFDVPAGSTINEVIYYDDPVAGTSYGTSSVTEETFAGAGTYTVSSATITHQAA